MIIACENNSSSHICSQGPSQLYVYVGKGPLPPPTLASLLIPIWKWKIGIKKITKESLNLVQEK